MRTTVDIDKDLLSEATALANVKTQRKAVSLALQEFVRTKRLERLAARVGTFGIALDQDELEQMRRGD